MGGARRGSYGRLIRRPSDLWRLNMTTLRIEHAISDLSLWREAFTRVGVSISVP